MKIFFLSFSIPNIVVILGATILFPRGYTPTARQMCDCTHLLGFTGTNRHFLLKGLTQT